MLMHYVDGNLNTNQLKRLHFPVIQINLAQWSLIALITIR